MLVRMNVHLRNSDLIKSVPMDLKLLVQKNDFARG